MSLLRALYLALLASLLVLVAAPASATPTIPDKPCTPPQVLQQAKCVDPLPPPVCKSPGILEKNMCFYKANSFCKGKPMECHGDQCFCQSSCSKGLVLKYGYCVDLKQYCKAPRTLDASGACVDPPPCPSNMLLKDGVCWNPGSIPCPAGKVRSGLECVVKEPDPPPPVRMPPKPPASAPTVIVIPNPGNSHSPAPSHPTPPPASPTPPPPVVVSPPPVKRTYGALAIDYARGSRWGASWTYPTQAQAEQRARAECGSGCSVVMWFYNTCAAYAIDDSPGSTIYGWATGNSIGAAQSSALGYCSRQGGSRCMVRVWGCTH